MTKKSGDISRALRQKGFAEDRKRDHLFYFFIYREKKTQIYTEISHSASEIDPHLFGMMARQVKLSVLEFAELVSCKMDGAAYAELLIQRDHITPSRPSG